MNVRVAIILLVGLLRTYSQSFTLLSSSLAPDQAKLSNSLYQFAFRTPTPITTPFDLRIAFSTTDFTSFLLSSNCTFSRDAIAVSGISCAFDAGLNQVIFSNLQISSVSNFTVTFWGTTSRYATTSTLTFSYRVPGSTTFTSIPNNLVQITTTNSPLSCSMQSSSAVVGANTTYNLNFSSPVLIEQNTVVKISMDPWSYYLLSNFVSSFPSEICEGKCSLLIPSNNGNLSETLTYSSLFASSTGPVATVFSSALKLARNPASTQPISYSITLFVNTSSSLRSYATCNNSFSVSTPQSLSSLIFAPSDPAISVVNSITLRANPVNPLFSSSVLRVDPNGLPLSFSYSSIFPSGALPNS